jgi:hypothetical protein
MRVANAATMKAMPMVRFFLSIERKGEGGKR